MILYIFLSLLFIFGSVVFKWLIDENLKEEDRLNRKRTLIKSDGSLEDVSKIKNEFTWKRRLYTVMMVGCIVYAINFLIRISFS